MEDIMLSWILDCLEYLWKYHLGWLLSFVALTLVSSYVFVMLLVETFTEGVSQDSQVQSVAGDEYLDVKGVGYVRVPTPQQLWKMLDCAGPSGYANKFGWDCARIALYLQNPEIHSKLLIEGFFNGKLDWVSTGTEGSLAIAVRGPDYVPDQYDQVAFMLPAEIQVRSNEVSGGDGFNMNMNWLWLAGGVLLLFGPTILAIGKARGQSSFATKESHDSKGVDWGALGGRVFGITIVGLAGVLAGIFFNPWFFSISVLAVVVYMTDFGEIAPTWYEHGKARVFGYDEGRALGQWTNGHLILTVAAVVIACLILFFAF